MSNHAIPNDVNITLLQQALITRMRAPAGICYGNGTMTRPTELEFIPDLDAGELETLAVIYEQAASAAHFEALPNWATWTADQAAQNVAGAIFGGQSLAEIDASIDALPATLAGMRTGLHQAAAAIIGIRGVLVAMARAVIFLRNLTLKK